MRPCRWTGSGGGFDRGAGVAVGATCVAVTLAAACVGVTRGVAVPGAGVGVVVGGTVPPNVLVAGYPARKLRDLTA